MFSLPSSVRNIALIGTVVALAACQQTAEQIEAREVSYDRQGASADAVLRDPTLACSAFLTTGSLPAAKLESAGFSPARKMYVRQITPPSFSMPNGHNVGISTSKRGVCNMNVVNAPFGLLFTQTTVHNTLVQDGWTSEGNLFFSKNGKRIKMNGGSSYGVAYIGFTPK